MQKFENEFTYRRFVEAGKEDEFDKLFDEAVERASRKCLARDFQCI